jgi:Icc protein
VTFPPLFAADALPTPDGLPAEVPVLVIAHLSDTHLTSRGTRYNSLIDPQAALESVTAVLARAIEDGRGPELIVVSGDLTDSGDPDAYQRLSTALQPLAKQVIYATGNHDVRTVFHRELLDRPDVADPILQVHRLAAVRIVVLDSTVVGAGHGVLTPEHLSELATELAAPYPGGTIVVMHHAPLPPPSPLLSYFALERASRATLAEVLAGTDTRIILAGHHHLAGSGTLGGVPVAVAPSTAIRTDPLAPPGHERTFASSGFNLVRVYRDTVTVEVIPVDGAAQVFDLDQQACADVIATTPAGPAPARHPTGSSSTDQQPSSR